MLKSSSDDTFTLRHQIPTEWPPLHLGQNFRGDRVQLHLCEFQFDPTTRLTRQKHETFGSLGFPDLETDPGFALTGGVVKSGRRRGMSCGDVSFHGGYRMIRFWMLAILLIGITSGVTEARDRHRGSNYQRSFWQSPSPMRYTTGTNQVFYSQNGQSGFQQQSQPISQVSSNGQVSSISLISSSSQVSTGSQFSTINSSVMQGNPMQAWAEEEARMMASRGTCGHIRPAPMGCFVGVGCGTTCMGSGRLVAEASYQGKMVRVWQR